MQADCASATYVLHIDKPCKFKDLLFLLRYAFDNTDITAVLRSEAQKRETWGILEAPGV